MTYQNIVGREFPNRRYYRKIDGESPSQHFTVVAYLSIEQAKIILNRDGQIKEYEIKYTPYSKQLFYHFIIPVGFYIVCFDGVISFNVCS